MPLADPATGCPRGGCFICLQFWDIVAFTLSLLLCWLLVRPRPSTAQQHDARSAGEDVSSSGKDWPLVQSHAVASHTVPRRTRRVKKLVRADLKLHFSDAESDSDAGHRSIDYSANFLSLDEGRVTGRTLVGQRRSCSNGLLVSCRRRSSDEGRSSNSSSSNNPSVLTSGHNSCDSLPEAVQEAETRSFLSDTLHNRCHILYEVFHERDNSCDFSHNDADKILPTLQPDSGAD